MDGQGFVSGNLSIRSDGLWLPIETGHTESGEPRAELRGCCGTRSGDVFNGIAQPVDGKVFGMLHELSE